MNIRPWFLYEGVTLNGHHLCFWWDSKLLTLRQFERFKDTTGLIRSLNRIWTNVAMAKRKKAKMTNNDLQYTTQKTNDRVARVPLKPGWTQVFRKGLQFLPSLVIAVVLLLLQTRRWVMNEGMLPLHVQ
jgi:hypothetical protein